MRAFVLVLLVGAATSFVDQNEWAAFKDKHGKTYVNPIEEFYRMKVYADNKAYVDKHNAEFAAGKRSFDLALNQFADLTTAEWSATYKGLIMGSTKPHETHELKGNAPSSQDWRQYGIVTGVKNQGQCGSCWSFATTGALEGAYAQAPGNSLTSFSEQQLVDCSGSYGNMGCNGGLMDAAFRYIRDKGITTESEYPYTASDGYCRHDFNIVTELSSYVDIPRGSESSLMDAAGSVGPVAVAIDASHRSFQLYNSGIYDEWACSSTQLDHGVLVVGYGPGYWLVKNSWGTGWGQAGYIQMTRDGSNQCGIATQASYPRL